MSITGEIVHPPSAEIVDTCECGESTALQLCERDAEQLALRYKALSHPVRLQILDILSRQTTQVCVCEIETHFSLTQPTISHHLKLLRDAGLIISEQRGLWVYHRIQADVVADLEAFLGHLT
ncbi:MAG: metalloregulator ArsR/SmtB family transcription factor [Chloroflexota bacterium]|nr:metalloregulator ArsR/SmtB family transcription factor [Chloroflexota bacterium]